MCDFFWQRSASADQGDLSDVVRAGLAGAWQPPPAGPLAFPLSTSMSPTDAPAIVGDTACHDPFADLRDPLLDKLPGPELFDVMLEGGLLGQKVEIMGHEEVMSSRPCDVFSQVLQISRTDMAREDGNAADVEAAGLAAHVPGIKRRKSEAKKVVCIPAPTAAAGRPSSTSGEVVPSDLWAWRKYGQKPIKGSPYPRGYYRCSSSKGCSARKQVERSRTDPNMLVITYTSEHNHPWPTQRNALAGSTRPFASKNANSATSARTSSSSQCQQSRAPPSSLQETSKKIIAASSTSCTAQLKREVVEMDVSYKSTFPEVMSRPVDDLFADLAELDADPVGLIFSKGFSEAKAAGDQEKGDKAAVFDPFSFFDWVGSSFGEGKRGL